MRGGVEQYPSPYVEAEEYEDAIYISDRSGSLLVCRKASDRGVHASADQCHAWQGGNSMQAFSFGDVYEDEAGEKRTL